MSPVGRVISAASIVTGVLGAAALGGVTAQRRALRRYRAQALDATVADNSDFDHLPADRSYSVVADDGVVLQVEETGPEQAPLTIVFAHGWTLRMGAWHYQRLGLAGPGFGSAPASEAKGNSAPASEATGDSAPASDAARDAAARPAARLVFYDQRSHGRSSRARAGHSTMADLAGDLAAVIATAAPTGPLVVIAHSMGGMALITLAGLRPDLIAERLVGAAVIGSSATHLAQPEVSRLITSTAPLLRVVTSTAAHYPAILERGRASSRDVVWLLTRSLGFARKDVPAPLVDYLDEMISDTPIEVIAEFAPALLALDQQASLPALSGIPVLVLCGDQDRITPTGRSLAIVNALPEAEFVLVKGAGHMVMMEAPDEVNDALRLMLVAAVDRARVGRRTGRRKGSQ